MSDLGMTTLATAVLARIEEPAGPAAGGARVLRWSNAGHPPPLLVGPDGAVELLTRPRNLLLGVLAETSRTEHTIPLPAGSTVVLYTDGLVEQRGTTLDDGLDQLIEAARDLHVLPVEALCDAVLARMSPDFTDDVALVALRVLDERPVALRD